MNAEFYTGNRKKFLEKLDEGSVVLLHSGILPVKSNDQDMHPFPINRNFYYLTGIDAENVWLVMAKSAAGVSARLFIDQPDEELIKWNGKMLTREGIKHNVLNAKHHEKEAEIVAQAGKFGAVTVATNMAGRGTDIMLGGNAEFLAKADLRRQGMSDELIAEATGFADTDDQEIIDALLGYAEMAHHPPLSEEERV